LHVDEHDVSGSGWPLGLWQYCNCAATHSSAFAMTAERKMGPESAADVVAVRSTTESSDSWAPVGICDAAEHPTRAAIPSTSDATESTRIMASARSSQKHAAREIPHYAGARERCEGVLARFRSRCLAVARFVAMQARVR
jgi:hypothetical protein